MIESIREPRGEREAWSVLRARAGVRTKVGWEGGFPPGSRAEPDLPRGAFGPWPRASAPSRDRFRSQVALSASARTRVFHRDGRGRRQDAGRRAHSRRRPGGGEPWDPPCEDGLSAASTESRSRGLRPPPRAPL